MTDALLLDTCALLWLASGDRALSGKARTMIENAQILCVSPVTAWEIAVKASKRKIQLPLSPREWFDAVVKLYDIHVLKLTADDMLNTTSGTISTNTTSRNTSPTGRTTAVPSPHTSPHTAPAANPASSASVNP